MESGEGREWIPETLKTPPRGGCFSRVELDKTNPVAKRAQPQNWKK
jgi:hypothetical protein